MKSRYNLVCVCVCLCVCLCVSVCVCVCTTTPYLHQTREECTRQGKERKDAKLVAFRAPKTWKSHSTLSWHFIGYWTIWSSLSVSDRLCTVGCCHALVNPAPLPFCHSRQGSHYSNTMFRAMQIAISDTTSKSRIFMEKLQSPTEKHVQLTGWHGLNTNLNGQYNCGELLCQRHSLTQRPQTQSIVTWICASFIIFIIPLSAQDFTRLILLKIPFMCLCGVYISFY